MSLLDTLSECRCGQWHCQPHCDDWSIFVQQIRDVAVVLTRDWRLPQILGQARRAASGYPLEKLYEVMVTLDRESARARPGEDTDLWTGLASVYFMEIRRRESRSDRLP